MAGFLRTGAPLKSDLNLAIQFCMGVALLAGMMLARRGHYRAHALCQGTVMALNLILIASVMAPSFWQGVAPGLPAGLGPAYGISTLHAALGAVAQLLGLYILLRAGTNLLPPALRFQNYKLWMRTELALWWAVIIFGLVTYCVWL